MAKDEKTVALKAGVQNAKGLLIDDAELIEACGIYMPMVFKSLVASFN